MALHDGGVRRSLVPRIIAEEEGKTMETETDPKLTKLTVNLIPRAFAALEHATATTTNNGTETVNRALQLYAALVDAAGDAPKKGTGFVALVVDEFLGDAAYDVWIRRAR
jgi:hypothetical protein